jgi:hypothetical protein
MTQPTFLSNKAVRNNSAKLIPQGVVVQRATAFVPDSTVAGTTFGMIRFQPGWTLISFDFYSDDLLVGVGPGPKFDVGYLYDGTTGEDQQAYIVSSNLPSSGGSIVWPFDDAPSGGRSPEATDDGYLTVTLVDLPTSQDGEIKIIASFSYDL